jgi:hypothetical protein
LSIFLQQAVHIKELHSSLNSFLYSADPRPYARSKSHRGVNSIVKLIFRGEIFPTYKPYLEKL